MRWMLAALLVFASGSAGAQEPAAGDPPEWEIYLAPYLWGTGVEGEIEARGNTSTFDVELSDILHQLNIAVMGTAEARRGRLILISDLFYARLRDENDGPLVDLDVEMTQVLADFRAGYTIYDGHLDLDLGPTTGDLAIDLLPGFRYWYMKTEVEAVLPLRKRTIDESNDGVDAVVGLRARLALTERLGLVLHGDYGGFGIGSSSDPSWQFVGTLRWQASERWTLGVGWRALEVDREQAAITMDGPIVGAAYSF